ncbi:phage tail sheath family protein [Komarekiella sp. 'clone 1']|uniref:Phage tail sheath family protein n=1 Tax=Komarekiella delphini-convector SJRDD-AB1 TaxID=2593771 RepID=A0AA40T072_9NOST|nr:phage tail sheath C-terminal domain-containing protein [Komarekiella delphini-convector]MBD6618238.1 phage tail sheath family protein [Komarekiella delphini-convector SJRDD-AB1]
MPVTPTYPGVYIEEIPSGVRTITGVSTSITAFIGFALKGSTNDPIRIQSFGDYERQFGKLTLNSTMGYAVQQFFLNGGTDALIVRLSAKTRATTELKAADKSLILEAIEPGREGDRLTATVNYTEVTDDTSFNLIIKKGEKTVEELKNVKFDQIAGKLSKSVRILSSTITQRPDAIENQAFTGGTDGGVEAQVSLPTSNEAEAPALVLNASSEGAWGNDLKVIVDHDTADQSSTPEEKKTFNVTITYIDGEQRTSEKLRNLSIDKTSPRYVVEVFKTQSFFARVDEDNIPAVRPQPSNNEEGSSFNGGQDSNEPPTNDNLYTGSKSEKTGIYALEKADLFNLLCIPPVNREIDISPGTWATALQYCFERRAMLIVDPPLEWINKDAVLRNLNNPQDSLLAALGKNKNYAALFFPRVKLADPLKENRLETFVPCGVIAGTFARTDAQRGVWKAPAGIDTSLSGVRGLTVSLTDGENGQLNPLGINCLRFFPVYGNVVWGSRTLEGDDRLASEWKYIPVRRLALFLEESLYRGTQWVVFEPNDEPLWSQIRLNLGAFMNNLFRQGAFQGKTPREAYFVKCDKETTTQNDIDRGIVNIIVGFAPLKPAEFVIIKFQQIAGQLVT